MDRKKKKEILVKWRGLGDEEICWERAKDLHKLTQKIKDQQGIGSSRKPNI